MTYGNTPVSRNCREKGSRSFQFRGDLSPPAGKVPSTMGESAHAARIHRCDVACADASRRREPAPGGTLGLMRYAGIRPNAK